MEPLTKDILRLILAKYVRVGIPSTFSVCKRFNELFNLQEKGKIYAITAFCQRKVKRRVKNSKKHLAGYSPFKLDKISLSAGLLTVPHDMFVFDVEIPVSFGYTARHPFEIKFSHIFCDRCDAVIQDSCFGYTLEGHHERCKGGLHIVKPLFSKEKRCSVRVCPYRTKVLWELAKHEYECNRRVWKCKLCGTEGIPGGHPNLFGIPTEKLKSHLSTGCQPIKDILKRRFEDQHSVLWRQWIESKTYMRFKDRRRRLRKTIKRDLMKEYFKCETFVPLDNV